MTAAVDWVKSFFDAAGEMWGPPQIRDVDRRRAEAVGRACGPGRKRVLELGAGGGTTAAATADLGHAVVAVELSSVRATYARELARGRDVTVVEGDFYDVAVEGPFDCVAYFNGFGIGTDADQRRLLRLVCDRWLSDNGGMVVDVFNPSWWTREKGKLQHVGRGRTYVNYRDYDPVAARFIDRWWPNDDPDNAITQSARCYSPPDLLLLLEGTGLAVERLHADGWDTSAYEVTLVRSAGSPPRR